MLDSLSLDFNYLNVGIILSGAYFFLKIINMIFKSKNGDGWLAFFKIFSYGSLAVFIYIYYSSRKENVPVIDAFTFICCCFELCSNLTFLLECFKKCVKNLVTFFKN